MHAVQVSARIDESVKQAMEDDRRTNGFVMKHVIQEAILDRLDELEDTEEIDGFASSRPDPTVQRGPR